MLYQISAGLITLELHIIFYDLIDAEKAIVFFWGGTG